MKKKVSKLKKPQQVFLVSYDVEDNGDPVIEYRTMKEVVAFCEAVMKSDENNYDVLDTQFLSGKDYSITEIRKDSLKVYKATLVGKPVFKMELIN